MNLDDENHLLAAAGLLLLTTVLVIRSRKRNRRFKTRPIYRDRKRKGFFAATFLPMKRLDHEQFFKYTRMTVPLFDNLLRLVSPHIKRRNISDGVSPEQKLEITLQ